MSVYALTSEWKKFVASPQTTEWQARITLRLEELFQSGQKISAEAFADITAEFSPELQAGFVISMEGKGFSHEDETRQLDEARWLVGNALARLMLDSDIDAHAILKYVEAAHAWCGFRSGLADGLTDLDQAQKLARRYEAMIKALEKQPESYSFFSGERDNLAYWARSYQEDKDLDDAFDGNRLPYPVHVPAIGSLSVFMPPWSDLLAQVLSCFRLPPVMSDVLWLTCHNWGEEGANYMGDLLRKAPLCMTAFGASSWNGNLLAPAILSWGLTYGIHKLDNARHDRKKPEEEIASDLKKMWHDFSTALKDRSDGAPLVRAFIARQLKRFSDPRALNTPAGQAWQIAYAELINLIPDITANPDATFQAAFGLTREEADKTWGEFVQTGLLAPGLKDFNLASLLSLLPDKDKLSPETAAIALNFLDRLVCHESNGLYANEFGPVPDKSHWSVGTVYAAVTEPLAAWQNTWGNLSALRYQFRQNLYGPQRKYQEPMLNAILVCGLCACAYLKESGNGEKATELTKAIEKAINDYMAWNNFHNNFLPILLDKLSKS